MTWSADTALKSAEFSGTSRCLTIILDGLSTAVDHRRCQAHVTSWIYEWAKKPALPHGVIYQAVKTLFFLFSTKKNPWRPSENLFQTFNQIQQQPVWMFWVWSDHGEMSVREEKCQETFLMCLNEMRACVKGIYDSKTKEKKNECVRLLWKKNQSEIHRCDVNMWYVRWDQSPFFRFSTLSPLIEWLVQSSVNDSGWIEWMKWRAESSQSLLNRSMALSRRTDALDYLLQSSRESFEIPTNLKVSLSPSTCFSWYWMCCCEQSISTVSTSRRLSQPHTDPSWRMKKQTKQDKKKASSIMLAWKWKKKRYLLMRRKKSETFFSYCFPMIKLPGAHGND